MKIEVSDKRIGELREVARMFAGRHSEEARLTTEELVDYAIAEFCERFGHVRTVELSDTQREFFRRENLERSTS